MNIGFHLFTRLLGDLVSQLSPALLNDLADTVSGHLVLWASCLSGAARAHCSQAGQLSADMVMLGAFDMALVHGEMRRISRTMLPGVSEAVVKSGLAKAVCVWLRAEESVPGDLPSPQGFPDPLHGSPALWEAAARWCRPKPDGISPFLDTCTQVSATVEQRCGSKLVSETRTAAGLALSPCCQARRLALHSLA